MSGMRLDRDADGRVRAVGSSPLADFLNADVPDPGYADELAAEAERGGPADLTGNAYAVTIGAQGVMLTHLHLPDRPAVLVPVAEFTAALRDWAGMLRREA